MEDNFIYWISFSCPIAGIIPIFETVIVKTIEVFPFDWLLKNSTGYNQKVVSGFNSHNKTYDTMW